MYKLDNEIYFENIYLLIYLFLGFSRPRFRNRRSFFLNSPRTKLASMIWYVHYIYIIYMLLMLLLPIIHPLICCNSSRSWRRKWTLRTCKATQILHKPSTQVFPPLTIQPRALRSWRQPLRIISLYRVLIHCLSLPYIFHITSLVHECESISFSMLQNSWKQTAQPALHTFSFLFFLLVRATFKSTHGRIFPSPSTLT